MANIAEQDVTAELRRHGYEVRVGDYGVGDRRILTATKRDLGTGAESRLELISETRETGLSPVVFVDAEVYAEFNKRGVLASEAFRQEHPYYRESGERPPRAGDHRAGEHGREPGEPG